MNEAFFISLFIVVYVYFGYPVLIWAWAYFKPKKIDQKDCTPDVCILIAAHNEEKVIAKKIQSCLELDYPKDKLEIVIASDGSCDDTNNIVSQYDNDTVKLIAYQQREGKTKTINKTVPSIASEIILFTDASEMFAPDALKHLVRYFSDPSIGCVSGELMFLEGDDTTAISKGVGLYWRYEKFLRLKESDVDSMLGATGAIYAMRRELFRPPPASTILDDVLIPFAAIAKGYRAVMSKEAKAYERISKDFDEEFSRKVRTLAGNYQMLFLRPSLLNPFRNRVFLQLISHKILRLLVPYLLLLILAASIIEDGALYGWMLILQCVFYGMAILGALCSKTKLKIKMLGVPYFFCVLNLAAFCGLFYFLMHGRTGVWKRTKE